MAVTLRTMLFVATMGFVLSTCGTKADRTAKLVIENHSIDTIDGKSILVEYGSISVPENRAKKEAGIVKLPFVRIPTSHPEPLPPIFLFEGGPANNPSALQQLGDLLPLLTLFTERSDVVVVEQRGNGGSVPNLSCPGSFSMPLNQPLSFDGFKKAYQAYVSDCAEYWESEQKDLSAYHVIEMVEDIEDLRTALAYSKIMVFGGSFGSHWGLSYLKNYPQFVDRMLLDSPEGLDHTVKLPQNTDLILQQLSDLVGQDPNLGKKIPDFLELIKNILMGLEANPKTVKVQDTSISVGKLDLQLATALTLGREGYRELPFHYLEMQHGNFDWLANFAYNLRMNQGRNLMAILTDCTSGASAERWHQVAMEAEHSILGDAMNNINFTACGQLPNTGIGEYIRKGFYAETPLLLLCGSQDARTPVANGKEILASFPNGKMTVVRYGSHDLFQEAFDTLLPVMLGFLTTEEPSRFSPPSVLEAPLNLRGHY